MHTNQGQGGLANALGQEAGNDASDPGQHQRGYKQWLPTSVIHEKNASHIRWDLDQTDQDEADKKVPAEVASAHADAIVAQSDDNPVDHHDQGDLGHGPGAKQGGDAILFLWLDQGFSITSKLGRASFVLDLLFRDLQ